jgi:hypothetical protein
MNAIGVDRMPSTGVRTCRGKRYALLFRGQSHHWGCDARSAFLQRLCLLSHRAMVIEPLEAAGHCVDVFLALNPIGKCVVTAPSPWPDPHQTKPTSNATKGVPVAAAVASAASQPNTSEWHPAFDVLSSDVHGSRVRLARHIRSSSQSSNFRHAINLVFRPGCDSFAPRSRAHTSRNQTPVKGSVAVGKGVCDPEVLSPDAEYDFVIVTRYDLRLLKPMPAWACHADAAERTKLGVASRCGSRTWQMWHCSFDTLFVVPRAHWFAFDKSVGERVRAPNGRTTSCCFNEVCMAGGVAGTGQACVNVFTARLPRGLDDLSFCFPPPSHGGSHPPNGPDYQCCSRGVLNWSRVYEVEVARDPTAVLGAFTPGNTSSGWTTLGDRFRAMVS